MLRSKERKIVAKGERNYGGGAVAIIFRVTREASQRRSHLR